MRVVRTVSIGIENVNVATGDGVLEGWISTVGAGVSVGNNPGVGVLVGDGVSVDGTLVMVSGTGDGRGAHAPTMSIKLAIHCTVCFFIDV